MGEIVSSTEKRGAARQQEGMPPNMALKMKISKVNGEWFSNAVNPGNMVSEKDRQKKIKTFEKPQQKVKWF